MINKKGDEKYYIIISLILGIIIIAISMYFIFQEYFNDDKLSWETCRQSIILRNTLPENQLASSKGIAPLKCKTEVINIDTLNRTNAERQIADSILSSWNIIGNGNFLVFPGDAWALWGVQKSPCMVFVRVALSEKSRREFSGSNKINLEESLNLVINGKTYFDFLNPKDKPHAFQYFNNWNDTGFSVVFVDASLNDDLKKSAKVFSFPKYIYPEKGDLFIIYSEPTVVVNSGKRSLKPFLILIQQSDWDKLYFEWMGYDYTIKAKICTSYETIPA